MMRSKVRFACSRVCCILALLSLVPTGISCSSSKSADRKPVHPVRGQVFVKDKPAVGAFVLFVPVNEPAEPKDPRPRAEVDQDGSFTLSTYDGNDGAPIGDYLVSIVWPGEEDVDDKLLGRYGDAKTSNLRATVKEGPNDLPAFRLK